MILSLCLLLFFFFKQKTAYEMRISDWSSDVCSSDLALLGEQLFKGPFAIGSGMAALILVTGPIASLAIWSIRKPYRIALDQAEAREASAQAPEAVAIAPANTAA